jgi:hypothetical protein
MPQPTKTDPPIGAVISRVRMNLVIANPCYHPVLRRKESGRHRIGD